MGDIVGPRLMERGHAMDPLGQPDFMVMSHDDIIVVKNWLINSAADVTQDFKKSFFFRQMKLPFMWGNGGDRFDFLHEKPQAELEYLALDLNLFIKNYRPAILRILSKIKPLKGLGTSIPDDRSSWFALLSQLNKDFLPNNLEEGDGHLTPYLSILENGKQGVIGDQEITEIFELDKTPKSDFNAMLNHLLNIYYCDHDVGVYL